jgi:hypothetical protein
MSASSRTCFRRRCNGHEEPVAIRRHSAADIAAGAGRAARVAGTLNSFKIRRKQ